MRKQEQHFGYDTVVFFGTVEDINDPLQIGRARVRCYGWHTQDTKRLPTSSLPWAQPIQSLDSAAVGDVGVSPTNYVIGQWVVGLFLDGEDAQQPMILGSVAGVPEGTTTPDVNRLARNGSDQHPVLAARDAGRKTSIEKAFSGSWDQPASTYAATYPSNHVTETAGGHIVELDDTSGAKRSVYYHPSGSFEETDNAGNRVQQIAGDGYRVVAGSDHIYVEGSVNITVGGSANIKGDIVNIESNTLNIKTNQYKLQVEGRSDIRYEGDKYEYIGADTYSRHDSGTGHSCPTDPVRLGDISCDEVESPTGD